MFIVVPDGHDSLLGDKACKVFGLVKRVYSINSTNARNSVDAIVEQFPEFGVLPFTYKIQLKEDSSSSQ